MATLVLSAAGAALGAGFGGTVLGLSGAVMGRALGATLGRVIDQRLFGGSEAVSAGRIDRLRLTGASEGQAIPQLWGRMRLGAQVLWAAPFEEYSQTQRGGKGSGPNVTQYGYRVSLALGLCLGPILRVGRIWADGEEIAARQLTLRLYRGDEAQQPDPKMEAVEGVGMVPAYRGLAYVVIEDLDLAPFGNRVPMFSFEVVRGAQGEESLLSDVVRAVALVPGTGEYALASRPVRFDLGLGESRVVNVHTPSGESDLVTSLTHLTEELPRCGSVSLVVSWFGDDLRCGECLVKPAVEQKENDGEGMAWRVNGVSRSEAKLIAQREGRPIYGGTPCDQSVIEAIRAIRAKGQEVMFYPFLLMDQLEGNALPDPWTGEAGQPVLPWRGRITSALAAGRAGSSDRTSAASTEVARFFGMVAPSDFSLSGESVLYAGPQDWGFRRFILHYAHLCKAAGGVDAFCIGSEMVGLTRIRGAGDGFPAVDALRTLAAEVKAILGAGCKISYAADWTEYGSYVADGNVYFPLDALWADAAIDFIGIDNYMPLSDWRAGESHLDADWQAPWALEYLCANVAGGEYFDWYYDSPEGEVAQIRRPITDGAHGEPWIFRAKDLKSWWSLPHHPRQGELRAETPSAWVPKSKPIRFTEYGCAALDRGTNQPNKFLDLHSSESALPRASRGGRDDLVQMQYLRAMARYWGDAEHNPISPAYGGAMVDMARAHVWAWDARPYPAFPARGDLWADGASYARGHWLNGRATNQPLSAVIGEICATAGVASVDTRLALGVVRGYVQDQVSSARAALQPLLMAYGLDAADHAGALRFARRSGGVDHDVDLERLAMSDDLSGLAEITRAPLPEVSGVMRLSFVEADGSYGARTAEARAPDAEAESVAGYEMALALTAGEGRAIVQRWLAEGRIAREALRLNLPLSAAHVGPGDRLRLPDGSLWRVDRSDLSQSRQIEACRIEGGVYEASDPAEEAIRLTPYVAPVPVYPLFLDLPLLTGAEVPHQPHLAVAAKPWSGPVGLWKARADGGFDWQRNLTMGATIGRTQSPLPRARAGLWDSGPALRVKMSGGPLASASMSAVLNGANVLAIGDGTSDHWEIMQFCEANLVAPNLWELRKRLRGQMGSDGLMPEVWPSGSHVVLLDRALVQVDVALEARGLARAYRIGLAARGFDDENIVERLEAFQGIGLRPYRPAHLTLRGRLGQDLQVSWTRRTRVEGDNWAQFEVPLGEEREIYLLRILSGGLLKRQVEVMAPRFTYSAAMQAADGVAAGFDLEVAQISDRFGAGPPRKITFAS